MRDLFQTFILNPFVVGIALLIVFGFITRWAIVEKKEYPGYGLGWLISILLLIIYTVLFNDRPRPYSDDIDLNIFQILLPLLLGILSGFATQFGRLTGRIPKDHQPSKRSIAMQAALYTCINLCLIGLVIIEDFVVQRMVGIYGLALGIALLMSIIWLSIDDDDTTKDKKAPQQDAMPPQGGGFPQSPQQQRPQKPEPRFKNHHKP